jgi:4-amino-4-deoxy-L-arabinose transferase-like glycosyltransferase
LKCRGDGNDANVGASGEKLMNSRFWLSRWGAILFLVGLSSLTLLFGIGRMPLIGSDEPRYAEVAREMWVNSDYISPRLAGRLWMEKAPLLYWGQALCYSIFGVNELAARLPSALGALFIVLALYETARRVLEARTALYIGIVAASMAMIAVPAHGATTDMPLCTMFAGAFLSLFRSVVSKKHSFQWILLSAAFVGGAMLAKGLIGPLLFVLIGGIWWLWARPDLTRSGSEAPRSFSSRLRVFAAACAVFLAISAIWYLPVWLRHGAFFWEEFFVNHHFKRFTSDKYEHRQPFYFYIAILPLCALPWTLWIWGATRDFRGLRPRLSERDAFLSFAWVWFLVPIVFFSASGAKLPFYILPSFPALAILLGDQISRGALMPRGFQPKWAALGGATIMVGVVLCAFLFYGPAKEEKLSIRRMCLEVKAQMQPGERATFLNLEKDYAPAFYLEGRVIPNDKPGRRDTFVAWKPDELLPFFEKEKTLIVFARTNELPLLERHPTWTTQFLSKNYRLSVVRLTRR